MPDTTDGFVLTADSSLDSGQKWADPGTPAGAIPDTLIDAKGDLIVGTADDTAGILPVDTDGYVLTADSGETTGLIWAPAAGLPGAWSSYTPALTASVTNPTLGSGSGATGVYQQIGKLVVVQLKFQFGSSGVNAGSGLYSISVPVTGDAYGSVGYPALGSAGFVDDASTGARKMVACFFDNLDRDKIDLTTEGGNVTNSAPWTWAASDQILLGFFYQAA